MVNEVGGGRVVSHGEGRPAVGKPAEGARSERAPAVDMYTPGRERAMEVADYRALILEKHLGLNFGELRDFVAKVLEAQGVESSHLADMSEEDARAAVADDGYWGVEQTAGRIVEFALSASGEDPAKLDAVKAAIRHGYEQASRDFGGQLPEISARTLERVMEQLDERASAAENSGQDDPVRE